MTKRGRRDRDQLRDTRGAVETWELRRQILEDEPEQERIPLALVAAHERGREGAEVLICPALPTASGHLGRSEPGGLEQPEEDQPVQQRRRCLLLDLAAKFILGSFS